MTSKFSADAPIRIGFVGAGWSDRVQIPVFQRAGLTAQAVCAARLESAQRVAQKHHIPEVYASWQELIASPNVDVVSVTTPPAQHAAITIAALQAGKHVICEKPTALNLGEAQAMLAAAQRRPNQLAIIDHELRFDPTRLHLRQLLREGYVGDMLRITLTRLGSERLDAAQPWNWWCDAEAGGGMLGAVGSHLLDLARWLGGRIDALTAQLQTAHYYRTSPAADAQRHVTADDHAHLLLHFFNGVQGEITVSGMTPGGYGMSILVTGTAGSLRIDEHNRLWGMRVPAYPGSQWEEITVPGDAELLAQLAKLAPNVASVSPFFIGTYYLAKSLINILQQGDLSFVEAASLYDGLAVQKTIDAARKSHLEQTWVRL